MTRALKVFGTALMAYGEEVSTLGEPNHHRQVRAIVAAKSMAEAVRLFGLTQSGRDYISETGNDRELEVALAKPGQVFATALNRPSGKFIEITRKPHVPSRRPKRPSFEELQARRREREAEEARREFSKEELEYLVDMLGVSNNPVALSIAEKAQLILDDLRAV